jgi:hypothetical protein
MPVRKYRSVEAMPHAAFRTPGDPRNIELACELSMTAVRLSRSRMPPPGVHRYRSVAAAEEHRRRWEQTMARAQPSD